MTASLHGPAFKIENKLISPSFLSPFEGTCLALRSMGESEWWVELEQGRDRHDMVGFGKLLGYFYSLNNTLDSFINVQI